MYAQVVVLQNPSLLRATVRFRQAYCHDFVPNCSSSRGCLRSASDLPARQGIALDISSGLRLGSISCYLVLTAICSQFSEIVRNMITSLAMSRAERMSNLRFLVAMADHSVQEGIWPAHGVFVPFLFRIFDFSSYMLTRLLVG